MKYLHWIWKIIYLSCAWYIPLCIFSIFIIPDTNVGFVLAFLIAPFFGTITVIIKYQNAKNNSPRLRDSAVKS
jgi:hypothetical protein